MVFVTTICYYWMAFKMPMTCTTTTPLSCESCDTIKITKSTFLATKGHNSKTAIQLQFLHSESCLMLVNVCINFYKTFSSHRADIIKLQYLLFSVSKDHNSKNRQSRVMVLACRVMIVNICTTFMKVLNYRADTI